MAKYRTKDGDMLDVICRNYYGDDHRYVEAVLEANSELAGLGPKLPSGLIIELPDFDKGELVENQKDKIRLWSSPFKVTNRSVLFLLATWL